MPPGHGGVGGEPSYSVRSQNCGSLALGVQAALMSRYAQFTAVSSMPCRWKLIMPSAGPGMPQTPYPFAGLVTPIFQLRWRVGLQRTGDARQ